MRPINVLVGVNSSGKSTFLRAFPLLRQSVETITTGPVLWYGRYVDFGTFEQAVRRSASPAEISFDFGLTLKTNTERYGRGVMFYSGRGRFFVLEDTKVSLSLSLGRAPKDGKTFTRRIKMRIGNDLATVEGNDAGDITLFRINEWELSGKRPKFRFIPGDNLLPQLIAGEPTQSPRPPYGWGSPFDEELVEALRPLFPTKVASSRAEIAHSLPFGSPERQLTALKSFRIKNAPLKKMLSGIKIGDPHFRKFRNLHLAEGLARLFFETDALLSGFFRPVRYIAPVRATAERYHRQQDLAVDEVDPQGANLAMFLRSLSWDEKEQFSDWCEQKLGFTVQARSEGAHISLFLKETHSQVEYNIADMGFGFSQILPVLAQVWSLTRESRPRESAHYPMPGYYARGFQTGRLADTIAIEQPELHLHPRLQAKVADLFVAAAVESRNAKRPLTILFETHSETMVNRLGYLIAKGDIDPYLVQVLLFEKQSAQGDTELSVAEYNRHGVLENWPHGFFLGNTERFDEPVQGEFQRA